MVQVQHAGRNKTRSERQPLAGAGDRLILTLQNV